RPADERGVEAAGDARRGWIDAQKPVRDDRRPLALQGERLDRLDLDGVADELERRPSQQHLARRGDLLESLRSVDGVAAQERVLARGAADDHLAGVDP